MVQKILLGLWCLLTDVIGVPRIGQAFIVELGEILWENDCLEQLGVRLALILMLSYLIFEILLFLSLNDWRLEDLRAVRALFGIDVKHLFYNCPKLNGIHFGDSLYLASAYSFEKSLHAGSLEWWLERDHFIQNAPK